MGNLKSRPSRHSADATQAPWFTVARANKALPLVSRIVRDIVAEYSRLDELRRQRQVQLTLGRRSEAEQCEDQARRAGTKMDEFALELADLGVHLKDLETGLADFPGRRNGRQVMFCWKLGEPEVRSWHDSQAGFAGRRPIDEACE